MNSIPGAVWRRRMQELARNVGKPHAPLFSPLVFGIAAQIEAIAVHEMVRNSTRLRKNLSELRRMLDLPAVVCAVPSLMELEALGVQVNADVWPPQPVPGTDFEMDGENVHPDVLLTSNRLAVSIDVVRQFAAAGHGDPVIAVALTGPATLVGQLRQARLGGDDEMLYELVGRLLAMLVRLYAEAGAHLIQLHETHGPGDAEESWKGALGTAGNVARFHRIPPLLVYDDGVPESVWPTQTVPCLSGTTAGTTPPRAHGRAWAADPARWGLLPGGQQNERVVTSASDVPADFSLAELMDHVRRACAVTQ